MTGAELKEKLVDTGKRIQWNALKIRYQVKRGIKWVIENPEKAAGAAAAGAAILGGANKLMRSVNGNVVRRRELRDKKLRVYDPSLKAFVYLKKPISNTDAKRIYAEKKATGKRICEILAEKGMLRK